MQNIERDIVCNFLKKLSTDLHQIIEEMKLDFTKNPPQQNIKERLLAYKQRHQDAFNACLTLFIFKNESDQQNFNFKDYLDRATEEYQNDPEYMDLLKGANQEIDSLKDFIRQHLSKDPSIYIIKEV